MSCNIGGLKLHCRIFHTADTADTARALGIPRPRFSLRSGMPARTSLCFRRSIEKCIIWNRFWQPQKQVIRACARTLLIPTSLSIAHAACLFLLQQNYSKTQTQLNQRSLSIFGSGKNIHKQRRLFAGELEEKHIAEEPNHGSAIRLKEESC